MCKPSYKSARHLIPKQKSKLHSTCSTLSVARYKSGSLGLSPGVRVLHMADPRWSPGPEETSRGGGAEVRASLLGLHWLFEDVAPFIIHSILYNAA